MLETYDLRIPDLHLELGKFSDASIEAKMNSLHDPISFNKCQLADETVKNFYFPMKDEEESSKKTNDDILNFIIFLFEKRSCFNDRKREGILNKLGVKSNVFS